MAVPTSMLSSGMSGALTPAGGLQLDAWVRAAYLGVEMLTDEARAVLAGFETYLKWTETAA
jgi:hypothetical protein